MVTITIPSLDYKALTQYVKKGKVSPQTIELLGRVYEAYADNHIITARVLDNEPAIRYTVDGQHTKTARATTCQVEGLTITFDYDRSYE